eukprot:6208677-Pleurochrysis_carterae.AAC.2
MVLMVYGVANVSSEEPVFLLMLVKSFNNCASVSMEAPQSYYAVERMLLPVRAAKLCCVIGMNRTSYDFCFAAAAAAAFAEAFCACSTHSLGVPLHTCARQKTMACMQSLAKAAGEAARK